MSLADLRGALLAALVLPPAIATAQEPKVGRDTYTDAVEHGFEVKVPKDWPLTPPQPNDPNLLATYYPEHNDWINVGGGAHMQIEFDVLVFDDRERPDSDADEPRRRGERTVLDWVKNSVRGRHWRPSEDEPEDIRVKEVLSAKTYMLDGQNSMDESLLIRAFVAEFALEKDLRIAIVGTGPGEKKWRGYEKTYEKLAKSFKRIEVEKRPVEAGATSNAPRDLKREKLRIECEKLEGWRLFETENYFIVTDVEDDDFLDELMERIEAIRAVYLEHYPPEQARAITLEKEKLGRPEGGGAGHYKPAEPEESGEDEEDEDRSITALDPMAASRTSVLRVCKDRDMYLKYGGSPTSAGYWYSVAEELVIYDDRKGGGRDNTWITLNHEAFHQYIFYFYGKLAPHSWYNEGTGDFYSGYEIKYGRFHLKENPWRVRVAQQAIRSGKFAPLEEFVRWSKSEYYGTNDYDLDGFDCYALGWSFIYFLRTGPEEKPRGWQPHWGSILGDYLETLAITGDLDEAVDKAFEKVNMFQLQEAWKNHTLTL